MKKEEIVMGLYAMRLQGKNRVAQERNNTVDMAVELIYQLDEPEKVAIPQFVADYIERAKPRHDSLYQAMEERAGEEVNEWIQAFYNSDKFARAWPDGYEVEKEQQYYVMNKENELILGWSQSAYMTPCIEGYEYMKHNGRENLFQLTEKEIKDYDERYWAFAEEVTE